MSKYNPNKASKKQLTSEGTYRKVGEFIDSPPIDCSPSQYGGISHQAAYASTSNVMSIGNQRIQYSGLMPQNVQIYRGNKSTVLGASPKIIYMSEAPQQEEIVQESSEEGETLMSQGSISGLPCGQQFFGKKNIFFSYLFSR